MENEWTGVAPLIEPIMAWVHEQGALFGEEQRRFAYRMAAHIATEHRKSDIYCTDMRESDNATDASD